MNPSTWVRRYLVAICHFLALGLRGIRKRAPRRRGRSVEQANVELRRGAADRQRSRGLIGG